MSRDTSHIITLANIKGGVGKTTAVVNIAYLLATEFNKKVLVIDSDDQGNATKALGAREHFDPQTETLWYALNHKKSYKHVMVEGGYDNIWVVPSTKDLKGAQIAFGQSARGIKMFQRLLKGVEDDFDYVLIDTKPQINILLQSALAASTWFLIPSFPEPDSYDGFVDLLTECDEIVEDANDQLHCLGVLLTSVKKIPAHEAYIRFIQKHMKQAHVPLLKATIRSSNAIATGSLHSCPAVSLPGAYAIREDYIKVVRSIIRTVNKGGPVVRPDLEALGVLGSTDSGLMELEIKQNIESVTI
ncbi:ParA family protein [Pseudobacteriovorax antillogorgiicola]|uniref:Chromosome partitioning protein n=1 Tax=Pseudobacteriovorax antillogorgiicola TaxID=1513793 RepID=A0A1Y6CRP3_9BACT|nr:ParA family protein [Pseudobacteriovorax antillogorgiicola]TCS41174.1 chromosome partitioning protein [Pseudobacteriovorax antillogorgiicola]SMF83914.1 chromosome partitioning protein [Pseudobacteriovorax antillogorgiicola]